MKKQNLLKGALLLTTLSVIVLNVYFVASKNASRLNIDSFNIEALTQNIDGGMEERKYGPEKEDNTGECDQRYIIYYSFNGNKATIHHTAVGAKVDIPFKLGNASANASYDGNWDKNNSNVIILERTGGRKLGSNSKTKYCIGNEQICYEYKPCVYAANESRESFQKDMDYLLSL